MPVNLVLTFTSKQEHYSHSLIIVYNLILYEARDTKRQKIDSVPMNFRHRKTLSRQVKHAVTLVFIFSAKFISLPGRFYVPNRLYHNSANARKRSLDWARRCYVSERQEERTAIESIRRTKRRQKFEHFGFPYRYASGRCDGNEPMPVILDRGRHVAQDNRISRRFRTLRPILDASQTSSSPVIMRRRSRRKRLRKIYVVETCVRPKMSGPF